MAPTLQKSKLSMNILKKDENRLELEIGGVPIHILNALKRILQSEVKTIAADLLYLHKNTTVIQDEVLAHRLGLLPIKVPDEYLDDPENHVEISLDITCEEGTPKDPQLVFSRDLNLSGPAQMACPGILIAKLIKGQKLNFRAVCRIGTGKIHTKWSPVCDVTFVRFPSKNTYKFCIETVGNREPASIFREAIAVVRNKCVWASNPAT